ncbi:MAG: redox-regulated ATPase YchF [Clostridiaceae bacterium]|nr:redox-regulated ATPase YchF [Clostridiaceae bacterium]
MKLGIVGLPNVGKSTLFNAITHARAESANYPFCTIEPNVGVVAVPDPRLEGMAKICKPKKVTPAVLEISDIAGLVAGASHGEGLGNQFLGHIREVDAILHLVRCFDDPNIINVYEEPDSRRDAEVVNLELTLADLEHVERAVDRLAKAAKSGDPELRAQLALWRELVEHLDSGQPACSFPPLKEDPKSFAHLSLLTAKPVLYAANVSEDEVADPENNPHVRALRELAAETGAEVVVVSAAIEAEIALLPEEERHEFIAELGLEESGLNRIITAGYKLLGLISFLTGGANEVRAWTIRSGTPVQTAAGKIHSDMERGFIRAEVIKYDDLIAAGSYAAAREKGLMRIEGRDYIVKDGDVLHIRFNV